MIKSLTIVYVSSRKEPKIEWFLDSLDRESGKDYANTNVIFVTSLTPSGIEFDFHGAHFKSVRPKPTIWQGEYRITKEDWWAKCNAMNTGIALCETEWIAFVDDRSVLGKGWLQCVQDSMIHDYAVVGSYEKRSNMRVVNGEITNEGEILGGDVRQQKGYPIPSIDWYGGSCALPLEWCLRVNGYPEDICDGLGFEDVAFGILLRNNNFPTYYDSRMKLIEDRTPTQIDGALKRASKPSPTSSKYDAKDYRILQIMRDSFTSGNSYDLRELRERTLKGEPFPPPIPSHFDWFDQQFIGDME